MSGRWYCPECEEHPEKVWLINQNEYAKFLEGLDWVHCLEAAETCGVEAPGTTAVMPKEYRDHKGQLTRVVALALCGRCTDRAFDWYPQCEWREGVPS